MKASLNWSAVLFVGGLALLAVTPAVRAEDVPSFKKRGDKEKDFVTDVGTAIVKAARTIPTAIELDEYKFEEVKDKKDRKDLRIKMKWKGGITKNKYVSTIVVKIDTSNAKKWEVLNIEYKDDSISWGNPRANEIQALVKKFNRD